MSNDEAIILRHSAPSSFDECSYGTACKVSIGDDFELYVQINKHEDEQPKWLFIGTFTNCVGSDVIKEEVDNVLGR